MSGLIIALTVGFLLGILLMILLVAGRQEEDLLDRVERAETDQRAASTRKAGGMAEPVGTESGETIPKGGA